MVFHLEDSHTTNEIDQAILKVLLTGMTIYYDYCVIDYTRVMHARFSASLSGGVRNGLDRITRPIVKLRAMQLP